MYDRDDLARAALACTLLLTLTCSARAEPKPGELPVDTSILAMKGGGGETRFTISPDRKLLAVADCWGEVMLWNVTTENQWRSFKAHRGFVSYLAFSSDGKTLYTGSMETGDAKAWRVSDQWGLESIGVYTTYRQRGVGNEKRLDLAKVISHYREKKLNIDQLRAVLSFHTGKSPNRDWGYDYASCAVVSDDGKSAVVAGDSAVAVWDLATGKLALTIKVDKPRAVDWMHSSGIVVISADGSLAAVDFLRVSFLIDLRAGKVIRQLKGEVRYGATFSSDGKLLALHGQPEGAFLPASLIDCATGKPVKLDETFESNQKSRDQDTGLSDYAHRQLLFGTRTIQNHTYSSRWTDEPRKHPLDIKVAPLPLPEPKDQ